MGQLAMEEMANMKFEYTRLEKEVRTNMIDREGNLKEIRDRLKDLREETQGLVRTEVRAYVYFRSSNNTQKVKMRLLLILVTFLQSQSMTEKIY